jgi:hypothetical protein
LLVCKAGGPCSLADSMTEANTDTPERIEPPPALLVGQCPQ